MMWDGAKAKERLSQQLKDQLEKREVVSFIVREQPLWGLFVSAPEWPPEKLTVENLFERGLPRIALLVVASLSFFMGSFLFLRWLRAWTACLLLPSLLYAGYCKVKFARPCGRPRARPPAACKDWRTQCAEYFDTSTAVARQRRHSAAEGVLAAVQPQSAQTFNAHVRGATGIAVYGCGILAAAHVGALRALERHGMEPGNLRTLAGVSAGAVVVAMLAVGYDSEELLDLIQSMQFPRLAQPELGAVIRAIGNILQDVVRKLLGDGAAASVECLAGGTGPGLTSGRTLEDQVGAALRAKCGSADITLGEVKERFGKRLVIVVCQLDSGREHQFTPETDPHLPVRVAVRMSMGVPGLMEPFRYGDHVYCDGAICNDLPMNALPADGGRLGLMIRNLDWMQYNLGGAGRVLEEAFSERELGAFPEVTAHLRDANPGHKSRPYSVKNALNLIMSTVSVMMDANLALQIQRANEEKSAPGRGSLNVWDLAPEILTLCGGKLGPFDFFLTRDQHRDLFYSGQLCVHLQAGYVDPGSGVMSTEDRLKTMLFLQHLDYPKSQHED